MPPPPGLPGQGRQPPPPPPPYPLPYYIVCILYYAYYAYAWLASIMHTVSTHTTLLRARTRVVFYYATS